MSGIAIADLAGGQPPVADDPKPKSGGLSISELAAQQSRLSGPAGGKPVKPVDQEQHPFARATDWLNEAIQGTPFEKPFRDAAVAQMKEGYQNIQHAQGPLAPIEGLSGVAKVGLGSLAWLFSPVTAIIDKTISQPVQGATESAANIVYKHLPEDQQKYHENVVTDLKSVEDFTIQNFVFMEGGKRLSPVEAKAGLKQAVLTKDKVQKDFDAFSVRDPDGATTVADQVAQVDPQLAKYMKKKIQGFIDASDEELEKVGRDAAEANIKELEGNIDEIIGKVPQGEQFGLSVGEGKASPGKSRVKSGGTDYGKTLITADQAGATIRTTIKEAQESLDVLNTGEGKASPGRSRVKSGPSDYGKGLDEPPVAQPNRIDPNAPRYTHFDNIDQAIYPLLLDLDKSQGTIRADKLLDRMSEHTSVRGAKSTEDMQKGLIAKLRRLVPEVKIDFRRNLVDSRGTEFKDARGIYDSKPHRVTVNVSKGANTHVVLHELTHAATTLFIWKNPDHPLVKRLENLRKLADRALTKSGEKRYGTGTHYGLTDVYEFVAEAMTNRNFQQFLGRISFDLKTSLWSRFVENVKSILGFEKDDNTKFLEIALRTSEDLMEEAGKHKKTGYRIPEPPVNQSPVIMQDGKPVEQARLRAAFSTVDRVPGVEVARAKLAGLYESFIKTFNPEALGPAARTAGAAIARNFFDHARREHANWEQGKLRRAYWQRLGPDAGMQFINGLERGTRFENPIWEAARQRYEQWSNEIFSQDRKTGFTYDRRDHYMPHLFLDEEGVATMMQKRYGNKWADPSFIKDRTFNLYKEAVDAGFTPKFTNPEEILQARQVASDIAAMRTNILADFEKLGVAVKAKPGSERPPEGFSPNSRRSPTGIRYWVKDDVDPLMKNVFDSTSLWQMPGIRGKAFRGFMEVKNLVVPLKLAASGFHPLHVMHIDAAASITRATKDLYANASQPTFQRLSKFILDMATSAPFTPGGLYRSLWDNPKTGYPLLKVFQGKRPFESLSDADQAAFRDLAEGGLVPTRPREETSGAVQKFKDALATKSWTTPFRFPLAAMSGLSYPIYNVWIPSLKVASFLKDAASARKLNPEWTPGQRQEAFRQIARKVEARYGEMNYQSLFMNKMLKDIGVATNLSFGWNLGLIDQYAGGAIDLGRAVSKGGSLQKALASGLLDRPIMAAYYVGTALMIGGLIHKMMTGQDPKELVDYTHPQSGEVDQYGKPIRLNTMFYTREFEGLGKKMEIDGPASGLADFVWNKGSGMVEMARGALTGIDGLGQEIRDPNAPGYKQLEQTLASELAGLEPISIEALKRSTDLNPKMIALSTLGFTPAGKYISQTVTEGKIESAFNRYERPKEKPFQSVEMSKDIKDLRGAYTSESADYPDKLEKVAKKYDMDNKDIRKLQKMFSSPKEQDFDPSVWQFTHMSNWSVQKALLDKMSDEEREMYLSHLSRQKRAKYERETEDVE